MRYFIIFLKRHQHTLSLFVNIDIVSTLLKKTHLGRFFVGTVEQGLEEAAHGSEPEGEKKRRDRQQVAHHGEAQHLQAKH